MNLAMMQHSINWWEKNGRINIPLLEKILHEKEKRALRDKDPRKFLYVNKNTKL